MLEKDTPILIESEKANPNDGERFLPSISWMAVREIPAVAASFFLDSSFLDRVSRSRSTTMAVSSAESLGTDTAPVKGIIRLTAVQQLMHYGAHGSDSELGGHQNP